MANYGQIYGKSNKDTVIPPLITSDGHYAFTDIAKASTLNDYCCTISSVDDSDTELPYFENRTNTQIANNNISQSEISDILSSLKVNKACGSDGISHRMLKYTCKTIAVPFASSSICHCSSTHIQTYGNQQQLCIFSRKAKNQMFVIIDRLL